MSFVYLPFSISGGGGGGGGDASCDTTIVEVSGYNEIAEGGGCTTYVAIGQTDIVLPDSAIGDIINVCVKTDDIVHIYPTGDDTIKLSIAASTADYVQSSGDGSALSLKKIGEDEWYGSIIVGQWLVV